MTTVMHLVRHAAHDRLGDYLAGRTPGILLGRDGLAQAERLAERMRREQVGRILTSPRERCRQTADALARRFDLSPQVVDALDEIDFGSWSGKTFSDLNEDLAWRHWNAARTSARTPNGETMLDAQRRILRVLADLQNGDSNDDAVCVTHADMIKSVLFYILGVSLDRFAVLDIAPASISTIEFDGWSHRITRINELTP
jgi:broad specificity phosphatase PhoE